MFAKIRKEGKQIGDRVKRVKDGGDIGWWRKGKYVIKRYFWKQINSGSHFLNHLVCSLTHKWVTSYLSLYYFHFNQFPSFSSLASPFQIFHSSSTFLSSTFIPLKPTLMTFDWTEHASNVLVLRVLYNAQCVRSRSRCVFLPREVLHLPFSHSSLTPTHSP